ncbi:hypothetical protein H1235_06055 [Pseudoxanthomonas sp. NC8]|nr:hypothetical protein H1235_06055 [Pseudoxanthomonas sp. NC8]
MPIACLRQLLAPADSDVASAGNASTRFQRAPWSSLRHRPCAREPRNSTRPSFGSTARRSPLPRASSLPPSLNGRSLRWKLAPRSAERRIAPLPARSLV